MPRRTRLATTLTSTLAAASAALTVGALAGPSTAVAPAATTATTASAKAAAPTVRDRCVASVPDPGETEPVDICFTLFRPAGATKRRPVPMVMHSHGWGGSRATEVAPVSYLLDAGYAVLSFDQRGFGESGGHAQVMNPDHEGHDVRRLVRLVSRLGWVQQDGRRDPRLGAVGGSYGGGYQFLGAFESLRRQGTPVFDALAPEITWYDLEESLAPEGVVRTAWAAALSAGSLPSDALPPAVYKALVEGAATASWPDGSQPGTEDMVTFMRKNGPKWQVRQGRRLDVPTLFGQGTTDSLFPLEQGLTNFQRALTPRARKRSLFTAYNGGHVLPAVLPAGVSVDSDPCAQKLAGGSFDDLTVLFFDRFLKKRSRVKVPGLGRYHLATPGDRCVSTRSVRATEEVDLGTVASPTAASVPIGYEIAEGPLRIAGTPYLTGTVTALGVQNRAFYGLAVGTSPATARLVQNNVLPFHSPDPLTGEERRIDLPSVAVDVAEGESLYLLVSAVSDTFAAMSSRVPGAVVVDDTTVHLPTR